MVIMSKAIKFKNNIYIDSKSIVHNRTLLSQILNNRIYCKTLYANTPSAGEIGQLSTPGSSYTINDSFANYDFLVIVFRSRVWGWCMKEELIFNHNQYGASSIQTGNLYSMVMPLYNSNSLATMQYYFTNGNKITVYYNSHYTGDNHLYIGVIYGYKILSN